MLGSCGVFDTEPGGDVVFLSSTGRTEYSGSGCPAGVALPPGGSVSWISSNGGQGSVDYPCSPPCVNNGCAAAGLCGLPWSCNRLGAANSYCTDGDRNHPHGYTTSSDGPGRRLADMLCVRRDWTTRHNVFKRNAFKHTPHCVCQNSISPWEVCIHRRSSWHCHHQRLRACRAGRKTGRQRYHQRRGSRGSGHPG